MINITIRFGQDHSNYDRLIRNQYIAIASLDHNDLEDTIHSRVRESGALAICPVWDAYDEDGEWLTGSEV